MASRHATPTYDMLVAGDIAADTVCRHRHYYFRHAFDDA